MEKVKIIFYRDENLVEADEWICLEVDEEKLLYFIEVAKENKVNISVIFFEEEEDFKNGNI